MTKNKLNALITGAGSGIGAETAQQLAQKNMKSLFSLEINPSLLKKKYQEYILSKIYLVIYWDR